MFGHSLLKKKLTLFYASVRFNEINCIYIFKKIFQKGMGKNRAGEPEPEPL